MILRTTGSGQRYVQVRSKSPEFGNSVIPRPTEVGGSWTTAGRFVSNDDAIGVPAILAGIKLLSETVGGLPCNVYKWTGEDREKQPESLQWELLHNRPNHLQSPFDFFAYIVASLQRGNAYVVKLKANNGQIVELLPINPDGVEPTLSGGEIVYKVATAKGGYKELSSADVIHVRGLLWDNPFVGVSPITIARNSIAGTLSAEEFGNRWFQSGGDPGGIVSFPAGSNVTKEQREEMRSSWESRHGGLGNAHKVGFLFGGATYQPVSVSLEDARFVETQRFGVQQAARILGIKPASMLGDDTAQHSSSHPESASQEFLTFSIQPWLSRITSALHADPDLFPDPTIHAEFDGSQIVQTDIKSMYEALTAGRQGGYLSINDARSAIGKPPIPDGDHFQITPVGGAPNLQPGQAPAPSTP